MRRILISLFLGTLALGASSARAAFTVSDPNGVLERLGTFNPGKPFAESFVCDERVSYQGNTRECQINCNDTYCMSRCVEADAGQPFRFHLGVIRCSEDSVTIVTDDAVPLQIPISRASYERGGNTWIIPLLESSAYYIQPNATAEIFSTFMRFAEILENGKKRQVRVEMVSGNFIFPGAKAHLGFEIWYAPELKGPRQIVKYALGMEDEFLRLRGLVDPWGVR